ncbi:MAG: hypothetical protein WBE58_02425 [Verrucomicrobiales bacterium]
MGGIDESADQGFLSFLTSRMIVPFAIFEKSGSPSRGSTPVIAGSSEMISCFHFRSFSSKALILPKAQSAQWQESWNLGKLVP